MRLISIVVLTMMLWFIAAFAFSAELQKQKPETKTFPKPAIQPTPKPSVRPALKPAVQPAPKPVVPAPKLAVQAVPKPVIRASWLLQAPTWVQPDFYLDFSDKDFLKDIKQVISQLSALLPLLAKMDVKDVKTKVEIPPEALAFVGKGLEALLMNVKRIGVLTFPTGDEKALKEKHDELAKDKWRNVLMVRIPQKEGEIEVWLYVWGDRQGLFAIVSLPKRIVYAQVDGFLEVGEFISLSLMAFAKAGIAAKIRPPKAPEVPEKPSHPEPPTKPEAESQPPSVDLTGTWMVTVQTPGKEKSMKLILSQEPDGNLSGETKEERSTFLGGSVSGRTVQFSLEVTAFGQTFKVEAKGEVKEDTMSGTMNTPFGIVSWSAARQR